MSDSGATHSTTSRLTLVAWSVGFVLLWNSGFIGAEFGLPYSGPFTLLLWRYLALSAVLGVVVVARGGLRRIPPRRVARVALVGVLSHGVWLSCVLVPIDRGVPSGVVALVVALQPLLTGAFSGMVTGEHTEVRQWVGLVIGFAGVVIAVAGRLTGETPGASWYYLLPFGSAAAITVASLVQRRAGIRERSEPLSMDVQLLIQSVATTAALVGPAIVLESARTQWVPAYVISQTWLVLAVSLGAYAIMWLLLTRASATRVASLFFLGPPVTMLMAWALFGDSIVFTDVAGFAVAATGILLVTVRRRA